MPDELKKPWSSSKMTELLTKLGINSSGKAMSTMFQLDDASRLDNKSDMDEAAEELATMRVSPDEVADVAAIKKIVALKKGILKEYDRMDRLYQPEAYAAPTEPADGGSDDETTSSIGADFSKKFADARGQLARLMSENEMDKAKQFASSFATESIGSGFWNKSEKDLILPLWTSAKKESKKLQSIKTLTDDDSEASERFTRDHEMVTGLNGVQITKSMAEYSGFQKEVKAMKAAFAAKDGKGFHWAVDEATDEAAFDMDEDTMIGEKHPMESTLSQQMIIDYVFTKEEQAEMQTWDNPPSTEYEFNWATGKSFKKDGSDEVSEEEILQLVPTQKDAKKVDMQSVASVYGFGNEDVTALEDFARQVAKKGPDNPGVQKSAKDLLTKSKKQKNKPKVKNSFHLGHAMYNAMQRAMGKKKVTKPMKASEIPEQD